MMKNRLIHKYLPVNYTDCFSREISPDVYMSPQKLFEGIFVCYPRWVMRVMEVRNAVVKAMGIPVNRSFEDLIIEQNDTELVLGSSEKHLSFYVSLFCSPIQGGKQTVSLTTLVKYNNLFGRLYFIFIWAFHKLIVGALFRRALRLWCQAAGRAV